MRLLFLLIIFFSFSALAIGIPEQPGLMEDSYSQPVEKISKNELSAFIKNASTDEDFFLIGYTFYMSGQFGPSEKYYLRAIEKGSKRARVGLGRLYRDQERSSDTLPYFSYAEKAGLPEGTYEMGLLYEKGIGVLPDFNAALTKYTKAAQTGHYNSLIKLGLYSESVQRADLAVQYYDEAYKRVVGSSQKEMLSLILSQLYFGLATNEMSEIQRVTYYKKSGSYGNRDSLYGLAKAYESGAGTAQDINKAMVLYNGLAEKEYTPAMVRIGQLYYDGLNFTRDYQVSLKWFLKAAEMGDAMGATYLSDMYANGRGVAKDPKLAAEWKKRGDALSKRGD
jgi:TPR repeat protein